MASRILHFGNDPSFLIPQLSQNGYLVQNCGASLIELDVNLRQGDVEAITVMEDSLEIGVDVVAVSRTGPWVPLILFQGLERKVDPLQFDAAIPANTPASDWITTVARTIEQSRAILADSELLRKQSAALRCESANLRMKSEAERDHRQHGRLRATCRGKSTDAS